MLNDPAQTIFSYGCGQADDISRSAKDHDPCKEQLRLFQRLLHTSREKRTEASEQKLTIAVRFIAESFVMKIEQIMSIDVEVIRPEDTVAKAAQRMRKLDVGALPVCIGHRLMGMLTDRDITIRATAESRNPDQTLVRDCLSPDLVFCFEDQGYRRSGTTHAGASDSPLAGLESRKATHWYCCTGRLGR